MRLGQVFVRGALALAEIGNGVQPEPVDAGIQPALHHLDEGAHNARIVEVEVGLVGEETMPVKGAGLRVPGPVGFLGVGEDDARALVFLVGVAPDIPIASARTRRAAARALEPVVLVGGVIDDEFGDHAQTAPLRFLDEALEILHRPKIGIDRAVVGDVVAVITTGGRIERQQPQCGDAEILEIRQLLGQACEIADAVIVAVGESLDVELVDDGVLVPELIHDLGSLGLLGIDRRQNIHGVRLYARQRNKSAGSRSGSIRNLIPPHSMRDCSPVRRFSSAVTWRRSPPTSMTRSPSGNQNSRAWRDSAMTATTMLAGSAASFAKAIVSPSSMPRKRRWVVSWSALFSFRRRLSSAM